MIACSAAPLLLGCAAEQDAGATDTYASATAGEEATAQEASGIQLTGRVVDQANILSEQFEASTTNDLAQLEADTQVQMVVVTVQSLGGRPIDVFTRDLANEWGVGDAQRDDGLVILVAPNERQVRIAVGYGLETTIEDDEAKVIIESEMIPHFQNGDYETAIEAAVDSLIREISPTDQVTPTEMKEAA